MTRFPFPPLFHRSSMRVDATEKGREAKGKSRRGGERERERGISVDPTELAFWPFDGHPEIEFPLGR